MAYAYLAYMVTMGVRTTSGKNCRNFDHITMARMAEQRLNNLWKDFNHYQSNLETKQVILNFRFWLSKINIIYTCYKCEPDSFGVDNVYFIVT